MAYQPGPTNPASGDIPAVKRQRTTAGYYSNPNSGNNTAAYNSENDSGDDLFANFVPDTPNRGHYETQPTQIIDRSIPPASNPPTTPHKIVQVPASSPLSASGQRYSGNSQRGQNVTPGASRYLSAVPQQHQFSGLSRVPGGFQARSNVAMNIAPAGTVYRPPAGIVKQPSPKNYITIDDDDDGPKYQGGSSGDEIEETAAATIKPTTFNHNSGQNSFGSGGAGNARFYNVMQNTTYQGPPPGAHQLPSAYGQQQSQYPPADASTLNPGTQLFGNFNSSNGQYFNPQQQTRPERAQPIQQVPRPLQDIRLDDVKSGEMRLLIGKIRQILPKIPVLMAQSALVENGGSWERAIKTLTSPNPQRTITHPMNHPVIIIPDDEDQTPQAVDRQEFQMKRTLQGPAQSFRDKYSSTQALPTRQPQTFTPQQPKRRLVKGRRNPSSPGIPEHSSPLKPVQADSPLAEDYETDDSGVGSEPEEEDPLLEGRVLKFFNTCKVEELVELTNTTKEIAEIVLNTRPFKSLEAARCVENIKPTKSGKKSSRAAIGDKIVETAMEMFQGYEAIDTLVARCGEISKPLTAEMTRWGFDVFGATKDGELEMTSLDDDSASQRDSGIGSPSSGAASNNGDDDVKIISRKRVTNVQFLKKPETMAEDCVLKDYQVVGLNWLDLMSRHGLSGILADEMGLGKTCQVIAFLTHLVATGNTGPHLVVCPGSTLENWLREFQKFSPDLVVEPYHGPQKDRADMAEGILANRDIVNVVVTTYDMAAKTTDNKFLRKLKPDVCVYDEGHMLKNVKSQRYQGLVKIPARFRLLLTGTPLQNNLQELAALLAFILPDVFHALEEDLTMIFKSKTTTSDSDHAALLSKQRIDRARSMLTPFVLRRKKAQVLKHLPSKTCRVQYCSLHKAQKVIYDGHLEGARERARARVDGVKLPKSDENNPLMQLRKAAIHPLLFRRHFTDAKIEKMAEILRKKAPDFFPPDAKREHLINEMHAGSDYWLHQWCLDYPCINSFDIPDLQWMDSGKVDETMKLIKTYKGNGDRVLVFSQFSLVLDILESVLNTSRVHFTRIDGSTKIEERQSLIDTFRDDESITVFLLTTKAGGTGINLMYANKVIIFDGSFNPQDDRQAENRAHRVGQTREVEVVRLVTKGTVEEQIYALGQSKLELDGRVAGDEDAGKALEAGEKAVSKMLLEGAGMVSDSEETKSSEEKSEEEEVKVDGIEKKLPSRKKSSIIDMLTSKKETLKRKTPSDEEESELSDPGSDYEEILV